MEEDKKYKALDPNYKAKIEDKLTRQFFMKHMGMKLTRIEPGIVEGELDIEQIHKQQNYFVHGGVMATACDIVMGFAAYSLCPPELGVVTAELNVSFLKPGIGKKLKAIGKVTKPGASLYFCEANIYVQNDAGDWVHTNRAISTMHTIVLNKTNTPTT